MVRSFSPNKLDVFEFDRSPSARKGVKQSAGSMWRDLHGAYHTLCPRMPRQLCIEFDGAICHITAQ